MSCIERRLTRRGSVPEQHNKHLRTTMSSHELLFEPSSPRGSHLSEPLLNKASMEVSSLDLREYETLPTREDEKGAPKLTKPLSHIAHLNGLRALAFLGIVMFHFRHGCQGGFLGVDVFFVLSGYLMTRSIAAKIARGSFSYLSFLWRRFWRLYPALLCTTAGTLLFTYAFFSPELVLQVARSTEASTLAVSNLLFMTEESYFGTSSVLKPLLHTWSLSVEWQFYLIWPIVMLHASRFSRIMRPHWPLAILCSISFSYGLIIASSVPRAAFFTLPGRAFEFGLGALVLTSFPPTTSVKVGNALSLAGTALIVLSFAFLNAAHGAPAAIALPALIGALFVIASPSTVLANRVYTSDAFDYLGKISYSAYLVHWPVFVFFHNIYEHEPAPWHVEAIVVVSMMAVSAFMYHYVEDEFRTAKTRWHKFVVGGLVALVFLASQHATYTKGWEKRLSSGSRLGMPRAQSQTVYLQEVKDLYKPSMKPIPGTGREMEYGMVPNCTVKSVESADHFDGLVVGDSFAAPFAGAFDALAREQNKTFVITSHFSCAPFFDNVSMDASITDYASPGNNPRGKRCKQSIRQDILNLIDVAKSDLVVLTGNWLATSQMWKAGYDSVNMNPEKEKKLTQSQLEATIWKLHTMKRKIVVIGMVPGAHFNVRACMTATGPLAGLKQCPETSRFKEPFQGTDYLQKQMKNRVKIRTVFNALMSNSSMLVKGQQQKWLTYIDPYDVMCDERKGNCVVARHGEPFYSDEYHLTSNGTVLLKDAIAKAIESLK